MSEDGHGMNTKELEDLRDWMAKNLALVNAEIKVAQIIEMQKVHYHSGSRDEYGLGMYNGMEFAISIMKNQEPNYLDMKAFK